MKRCLFFFIVFFSCHLNAQVNRIDHFFVSSPKAEKLFNFFKEELGLPVSWNYKSWGSFASGAVTLGNVAFEFVSFDSLIVTKFDAIALEPRQPVEEFISILDANQIAHDTIETNTYTRKDGSVGGWSTLNLRNLLPEEAGLFICDYKDRAELDSAKRNDAAELIKRKGGPLGVLLLKEIVVTTPGVTNYKMKLAKLPGISGNKTGVFSFKGGTSIRLANSKKTGIEKIVIRVRSLTAAKQYLAMHKLLGNSTKNSVYINAAAIEGLMIELVEE